MKLSPNKVKRGYNSFMKVRQVIEVRGTSSYPQPELTIQTLGSFPVVGTKLAAVESVTGEIMRVVKFRGEDYFQSYSSRRWFKVIKKNLA